MDVIAKKPIHPPGRRYAYSNVGYTIAGAMAETASGVSWEDLVKREVFEPLARRALDSAHRKARKKRWINPRSP